MAYQRRARSFDFMGVVPVGKSFEVVPEQEDHPVFVRRTNGRVRADGTVPMSLSEFGRGLASTPPSCLILIL